ncbi:hypothetical protein CDV31_014927 [Fusarium ambrosium]|uniref:Uncharacterized protein n=1 Tax=Fusarium ambrosium TaxID=131363 RepID=A0A428ST43_9HYPO|nr:hypothetical protein CDV31_014927 [Fusarium ambrosium]
MHVGADVADIVSKEIFRTGLVSAAARWYEDFELADKTWDAAYGFGRDLGETPSSYFKRGEKLYHKLRGAFRQTLLTSLILRLNDGDKDLRL